MPEEKLKKLKTILREMESVAVAFSGGVDSAFLLKVASETLGEQAVAVTARSAFFPKWETREAEEFCALWGIRQITVPVAADEIPEFRENPRNRCYLCKRELFCRILRAAGENGLACVAEGSNMDDLGDYRPGMKAIEELGIRSPLREAGLYKEEIRLLSHGMGLPTWDKPSFACLASRFVYGEEITEEKLAMVEQAEELLHSLGFAQGRVRIHGKMARIEVLPKDFARLTEETTRRILNEKLAAYGFSYVTMDLKGYRMGSMNETFVGKEL